MWEELFCCADAQFSRLTQEDPTQSLEACTKDFFTRVPVSRGRYSVVYLRGGPEVVAPLQLPASEGWDPESEGGPDTQLP